MNHDLKARIAAAATTAAKPVTISSLGLDVYIRKLPAGVADELQVSVLGPNGKVDIQKLKGYRSTTIATCIVDEDSNQLFSKEEVEGWDNPVVVDVMNAINTLNKLDAIGQEQLGNG